MNGRRVKSIAASLPRRVVKGKEVGPSRTEVRKAKRAYMAARRGSTHLTDSSVKAPRVIRVRGGFWKDGAREAYLAAKKLFGFGRAVAEGDGDAA